MFCSTLVNMLGVISEILSTTGHYLKISSTEQRFAAREQGIMLLTWKAT
jgi:hypothetical protein